MHPNAVAGVWVVCAPSSNAPLPQQSLPAPLQYAASQCSEASALSTKAFTNKMRSIHAAGRNVAYRLRSLQKTPRPSFSPCTGRPVVSLHASQVRAQHDAARSQAPPLPWCPQPDLQQPLPLEKELQPPPQYTTLNTAKNLVGPAQDVPEQKSQTPTAGASAVARADTTVGVSDASESSLPFVCKECGSMFQTQHGLENHLAYKAQQSLSGQAASCRDSISVAGMKVSSNRLNPQGLYL